MRAALCGWYSRSGSRFRKHPSRFPYRWGLLLRAAPDHGYLSLFRRIPHHTPHRPLWCCRLLCHRYSLRSQLRCSCCACSCGCVCRCRRMTTRPIRDRECRIPRRIRHRFCLWCRWGFRYRRYVPLNTKHCHRCGSSGIQLHKPYDCSNHIFCIRGSHVSPHSHSFCSAPWLFLPPLLTRSPVSGTPLPAPSSTRSAIFSCYSLLVIKPCYPFRSNCTDSDASTASTTFRASASISISATKAMTCSRSCAGTCSALRLILR